MTLGTQVGQPYPIWGMIVAVGDVCMAVGDVCMAVGDVCMAVGDVCMAVGDVCMAGWDRRPGRPGDIHRSQGQPAAVWELVGAVGE
jgi:hypothetical protein